MNSFKSTFPYSGETIAEYPVMSDNEVEERLRISARAYGEWKNRSFSQRAELLRGVAAGLRRQAESLATLISREMGKVLAESTSEIEKCAWACDYYAEHAAQFLKDEIRDAGNTKSLVAYQPIGAVFAVMPWNFPFWQVFRFAAPTLMAGNTAILKHAPNVCGCAIAIERLFLEAGAPPGIFTSLIVDIPAVEKIIASPIVQAVTLTGSERAGSSLAALAGKHIRKSVMELGGSDALIVLPDADLQQAAVTAIRSRMQNAGQSCIAAKRFIVVQSAQEEFLREILSELKKLRQGNPLDAGVTTGPVARPDLADHLQSQLSKSVQQGAKLLFGGAFERCNVQPALITEVKKGMPAFDEETFGPLAAVISATDENDAIRLANDSAYGLGASLWTKDLEKGLALAKKIESGSVFINALVKSDPRLPFGGIKRSGYGRELGVHGIREFVNVKTISASES